MTRKDSRAAGLVARVFVNRIWQHLFGEGPGADTGELWRSGRRHRRTQNCSNGSRPSFKDRPAGGPSRSCGQLCSSAAYQQTSQSVETTVARTAALRRVDPATVDPENKLLWRMRTKRLEAEAIRDCVLAASGRLDSTMGGPPILLVARPDGLVTIDSSKLWRSGDAVRRSVYLLSRRAYNLSLLSVFDRPLFAVNCPKRDTSVIPLQSLTMLNDEFIAEEADHLASRIGATLRIRTNRRFARLSH